MSLLLSRRVVGPAIRSLSFLLSPSRSFRNDSSLEDDRTGQCSEDGEDDKEACLLPDVACGIHR